MNTRNFCYHASVGRFKVQTSHCPKDLFIVITYHYKISVKEMHVKECLSKKKSTTLGHPEG